MFTVGCPVPIINPDCTLTSVHTQVNTMFGVWSTVHWTCSKATVLFCFSGDHSNVRSKGHDTLPPTRSKSSGFSLIIAQYLSVFSKYLHIHHQLKKKASCTGVKEGKSQVGRQWNLYPNLMAHTYEWLKWYHIEPFLNRTPISNRVAPPGR